MWAEVMITAGALGFGVVVGGFGWFARAYFDLKASIPGRAAMAACFERMAMHVEGKAVAAQVTAEDAHRTATRAEGKADNALEGVGDLRGRVDILEGQPPTAAHVLAKLRRDPGSRG